MSWFCGDSLMEPGALMVGCRDFKIKFSNKHAHILQMVYTKKQLDFVLMLYYSSVHKEENSSIKNTFIIVL